MPDGVEDRNADLWEAPLAVADALGGDWPRLAREAATYLVAEAQQRPVSLGVRLLADLRRVFGEQDQMHAKAIIKALCALEEAPWGELDAGKPLTTRKLGNQLDNYGVKAQTVRVDGKPGRGYTRESLVDPWTRYLPTEQPTEGQGSLL